MDDIFGDVNAVVGVTGSFICDEDGLLVARSMPNVFDASMLAVASRTTAQTVAGLEMARRRKVVDVHFVYGDGRLVVKKFRGGCLCILCVRNINVPLLNLTANVAVKRLSEMAPKGGVSPEVEAVEREVAVEAIPLEEEAKQAVVAATEGKATLRVLGSVAVRLHCPSALRLLGPMSFRELDFACYGRQRQEVIQALESFGYEPNRRFNSVHGHKRLRFTHPQKELSIHIFVDAFEMHHKLDLATRLHLDSLTIPLSDLLLTKLQVVEMNEEELREIYALVHDHEFSERAGREVIETGRIVSLCADDWGWYKTVTMNIEKAMALAPEFLGAGEKEAFTTRIERLVERLEAVPKSLGWQVRARIGEGTRWYEMPEEL